MKKHLTTLVTHSVAHMDVVISSQDLHVSQGAVDSSVDMDRLNRNMPECGRQTRQVLQVSVGDWGILVFFFGRRGRWKDRARALIVLNLATIGEKRSHVF